MKELVTGHPYTTETIIQPDQDEFLILACDGLWDVCSDQEAVELIRDTKDPLEASKQLVEHALSRLSTDNVPCMVVRFDNDDLQARQDDATIGVEGDEDTKIGGISEADAIVEEAKKHLDGDGEKLKAAMIKEDVEPSEDVHGLKSDIKLDPTAPKAAVKNPS